MACDLDAPFTLVLRTQNGLRGHAANRLKSFRDPSCSNSIGANECAAQASRVAWYSLVRPPEDPRARKTIIDLEHPEDQDCSACDHELCY